jgi:hypothetical protein
MAVSRVAKSDERRGIIIPISVCLRWRFAANPRCKLLALISWLAVWTVRHNTPERTPQQMIGTLKFHLLVFVICMDEAAVHP